MDCKSINDADVELLYWYKQLRHSSRKTISNETVKFKRVGCKLVSSFNSNKSFCWVLFHSFFSSSLL